MSGEGIDFPDDAGALLQLVERMLRFADTGFPQVFTLLQQIEKAGKVDLAHDATVWRELLRRADAMMEGKFTWSTNRHARSREGPRDIIKFREAVYAPRNRHGHLCISCMRMTTTLYPIEWLRFEPKMCEPWMIYCPNCWRPEMWPRSKALMVCPKLLRDYPHLLHTKVGDGGTILYSVAELRYWATMPQEQFLALQPPVGAGDVPAVSPAAPALGGALARNGYRKRKAQ